jgi:hypothetical protein
VLEDGFPGARIEATVGVLGHPDRGGGRGSREAVAVVVEPPHGFAANRAPVPSFGARGRGRFRECGKGDGVGGRKVPRKRISGLGQDLRDTRKEQALNLIRRAYENDKR